ncbi:cytochrome P450 [Dentipellis sp. KUC8613]|nr:cytochrome P450 [Dentipellis sp. KUC8613]
MDPLYQACLIVLTTCVAYRLFARRYPGPLPPGPRKLPIIGNALQVPLEVEWKAYASWRQKYGDIAHLQIFGSHVLVVNSLQAARDLLEKKGNIYADRMVLAMGGETVGWKDALGMAQYGERTLRYRRLLHHVMGTRAAVSQWHPLINRETARMLQHILKDPDRTMDHVRAAVGATILMLTYGYEAKGRDDELVEVVSRVLDDFGVLVTPGSFYVDVIPALKYVPSWFPGASFKKIGERMRADFQKFANAGYNFTKEKIANGTAISSFSSVHLTSEEPFTAERDHDIKYTAVALYGGGADTTVAALSSFILAMTLFPDVQRKAQNEIDAVIGSGRLPTCEDKDSLPYVDAVCKEVLRWNPVAPLNIPHTAKADGFYNGDFIPKGTAVIVNLWTILHDPEVYSDPESFKPERFLPVDGSEPELDPHLVSFGFGRRICLGILLVDASLFTAVAGILAAFNISKVVENGVVVEPMVEYTSGISRPKPFKFSIKPRNEQTASIISDSTAL